MSELSASKEEVLDKIQIIVRQAFNRKSIQRYVCPRTELNSTFYGKVLNRNRRAVVHYQCTRRQVAEAARLLIEKHAEDADAIACGEEIHKAGQVADEGFRQRNRRAIGTDDA